jgi:sugar phosphate isomerase/epimerase
MPPQSGGIRDFAPSITFDVLFALGRAGVAQKRHAAYTPRMRLGLNGCFLPSDMADITPALCERVRGYGFSGIFTRFRDNDPRTTPKDAALRVRRVLEDHGLRMYQATGFWQNLVTPDETQRREAVHTLQCALRLAGWMGARGIDTGPGSMSPRGPWFPDPGNWTSSARTQLVKSLRECAPAAQDSNVLLSLEGHQLVTLRSAEITAEILDEVDSPWVRSDYDSANWIALHEVYDTTAAVNRHFDVLGKYIVSCHAKDIWVEDKLAVHLQDGCPGAGNMDFHTVIRRMEALSPEYPVLPEGCTTEELPEVVALMRRIAAEVGATIDDS